MNWYRPAAPELEFVAGRLVRVHPRLFANVIAFSARKRG